MIIDTDALRASIDRFCEDGKRGAWSQIRTPLEKSVGEVTRIAEHWHGERTKLLAEVEKAEKLVQKILTETGRTA